MGRGERSRACVLTPILFPADDKPCKSSSSFSDLVFATRSNGCYMLRIFKTCMAPDHGCVERMRGLHLKRCDAQHAICRPEVVSFADAPHHTFISGWHSPPREMGRERRKLLLPERKRRRRGQKQLL